MQAGSVTALAEVGTAPDLIMGLGNGVHDHGQLLCGNTLFYFTHWSLHGPITSSHCLCLPRNCCLFPQFTHYFFFFPIIHEIITIYDLYSTDIYSQTCILNIYMMSHCLQSMFHNRLFSSYIHGFLLLPAIFQHNTHSTTYKKNSPPSPFSLFYPDLPILLATMYISRIYKANSGHWAEMDCIAISCLWKLSQANCLQVWVLARKARVIRSV